MTKNFDIATWRARFAEITQRAGYDLNRTYMWKLHSSHIHYLVEMGVGVPPKAVPIGKPANREYSIKTTIPEMLFIDNLMNLSFGREPAVSVVYPGMTEPEDEDSDVWGRDDGSKAWAVQIVKDIEGLLLPALIPDAA